MNAAIVLAASLAGGLLGPHLGIWRARRAHRNPTR